jgi:hypothetical protein
MIRDGTRKNYGEPDLAHAPLAWQNLIVVA